MKPLTRDDVRIELVMMPEDDPIDASLEESAASWVRGELEAGNEWAWCKVRVDVHYKDLHASEHLGGCSYECIEDFRASMYYTEMVDAALSQLNGPVLEKAYENAQIVASNMTDDAVFLQGRYEAKFNNIPNDTDLASQAAHTLLHQAAIDHHVQVAAELREVANAHIEAASAHIRAEQRRIVR